MKKIIKILYLLSLSLCFSSCYNNAFSDIIFRTTEDPFYDELQVDSLSKERTIYLSWKKDEGTDKYYLMRSFDSSSLSWSCIYAGNDTEYVDTNLVNNEKYIYRLDKIRGSKYFQGNIYGYGWSSGSIKDLCEPNDEKESATYLEYDRICNLPCVGFNTNRYEYLDEDWYYIVLPPMRKADIVVSQHNLENSNINAQTNLRIQLSGLDSQPVRHQVAYQIQNSSYNTKTFYFKIFPERTSLSSGYSFCTLIEYTVSLNQITNY